MPKPDSAHTSRLTVGSVGLYLALDLYGRDCVIDPGTFYTTATVAIPAADVETFREMERQRCYDAGY